MFICKNNTTHQASKSAFTLIELLVVIVIIGILATLATIALTSSRVSARDAKRISDLKQISTALELYQADYSTYPSVITGGNAMTSPDGSKTYMAKVPSDPSANKTYGYFPIRNNDFHLVSNLEKGTGNLSSGPVIMSAMGSANATGLVGWWPLNGGSLANDISGNGNHGAITGATPVIGRYGEAGGAYNFTSGTTDKIISPLAVSGLTELTYTMWIHQKSSGNGYYISGSSNYVNAFYIINTRLAFRVNSSGSANVYSNRFPVTDQWNFIAVSVVNSGTGVDATFCLNDVFQIVKNTYANIQNTTNTVIGNVGNVTLLPPDANLSDVRIYNRALSQSEIEAIYQATKP